MHGVGFLTDTAVSPEQLGELANSFLDQLAAYATRLGYAARPAEALLAVASGRNAILASAARRAIVDTFIPGLGRAAAEMGTGVSYGQLQAVLGSQDADFSRAADETLKQIVIPAFAAWAVEGGL
ncbi:MAG TPA: hypothetical protein VFH51_02420, partial [Myxococcota bacterium]|nr:hypothetical protein [Myxococcota bacterium]